MCCRVVDADSPALLDQARQLFGEYAAWLAIDLEFQGFASEMANLPGAYARPWGALLLAYCGPVPSGCVALRAWGPQIAELKRLWVREGFRGRGVGATLLEAAVLRAVECGYARLRLDTLPVMNGAIALYLARGFARIPPYYQTPLQGTLFFEKVLATSFEGSAVPGTR